jgi:adenine-specific DNA methylase
VDISAEASREKAVRKGHISTLHLWWARRPLVACRAAVYAALVPASQFVPGNGTDAQKKSLGRANAAKFVKRLCRYPSGAEPEIAADIQRAVAEAQEHILKAHAERLTREIQEATSPAPRSPPQSARGLAHSTTLREFEARADARQLLDCGSPLPLSEATQPLRPAPAWVAEFKWPANKTTVTANDILAGRAPRPRVLDMFAGGGAIPLEALRLGCEAHALDLNPVAHIIQLCTLVYPQKFGKPDPTARGMIGPKNDKGETTWGGLAGEVRYWGNWVLDKVKAEIGDLYPLIPDPEFKPRMNANGRECSQEAQRTIHFGPGTRANGGPESEIRNPKSEIRIPPRPPDAGGLPLDAGDDLQEPALPRHRPAGQTDLALQKARPLRRTQDGRAPGPETRPLRGRRGGVRERTGF